MTKAAVNRAAEWATTRLRFIASIRNSNVDKKSYEAQKPIRLCNYTDVYYNEQITSGDGLMEATASDVEIEQFQLKSGDVIITKDSETPNDIGIPALVTQDLPGVVCGYHLTIVRALTPILPEFLFRTFQSSATRQYLEAETPGVTRFGLDQDTIKSTPIFLPSIDEQRRICVALERETCRIDALIAKKTRFIEGLREKRQALITHAVTKGLDAGVPMKDSGVEWLGEVPAHWKTKRLAAVYREVSRVGNPNLPVLSISIHDGISDDELDEEERDRKVSHIEDRSKYKRVAPGDLAYNMMRAWQGAFGAVSVDGQVSPAYVVAEPISPVKTAYIEFLLRTPMAIEEMRRFSRGIADFRMRLYWESFRDIKICLPPVEEQDQIVSVVTAKSDRIDTLIAKTEHSIELLREHRTALITSAVTGTIDLREAT